MSKVSILLCAYNAEAYIAEAVGSTLAQTYHDFELMARGKLIVATDGNNLPDMFTADTALLAHIDISSKKSMHLEKQLAAN